MRMPFLIKPIFFGAIGALLLATCGKAGFQGLSGKNDGGSKSGEKTTEQPVEVAGGFGLVCEQLTPSAGAGLWQDRVSQVGCNAITAQNTVVSPESNVDLQAILIIGTLTEEKRLNVKQTPHVTFEVRNKDFEVALFGLEGASLPSSTTFKTSKAIIFCGEAGNSCYDNQYAMSLGAARIPNNKPDGYVALKIADPGCRQPACLKIWVHRYSQGGTIGGYAVLNVDGLWVEGRENWQSVPLSTDTSKNDPLYWYEADGIKSFVGQQKYEYKSRVCPTAAPCYFQL